jgi:hypothetical protein
MRKLGIAFLVLLVILILGLGVWLGSIWPKVMGFRSATPVYNTATLLREVQTLSELVTVKYVVEKVVVLEDPPKSLLGQMFAGENRVLLVAHGVVKAGIDLGTLKPADVRVQQQKISITLPPARITDVYLDDNQTQVVERQTGLLRRVDKDLEQNARRMAVDDLGRAARRSGILDDASQRARLQLTGLFKQMGFAQVDFRAP